MSDKKPYFSIEQRIRQDLLLLLSVDEQFINDFRFIRQKHGIPEHGTGTKYTCTDLTNDELVADIHAVRVKYHLSEAYNDDLHVLLMSEQAEEISSVNFLWHLRPFQIENPDFPNEKIVAIKLYPETTLKDIIDYWPDIENHRNMLLELREGYENKRQKKRKNLERDIYIFNLKKEGKTASEITEIINKNEKFSSQKISYQDVPKIVKRLEDEVQEIIFGKYEEGINESEDI